MQQKPLTLLALFLVSLLLFAITVIAAPERELPEVAVTVTATDTFPGEPTPLLMLTEYDPWNMVLGSDTPSFVLYDNGQIIYLAQSDEMDYQYFTVDLSPREGNDVFVSLAGDSQERNAFFDLESYYDLSLVTDQPTSTLYMFDLYDGGYSVSVYGDPHGRGVTEESAPQDFLRIYDAIKAFEHEEAEPWQPEYFEVIVWEYETSSAVNWLPEFPDLDDPTTVDRDSVYSLYLPIEEFSRFERLVENASALRINDQTWAFSVRYPFPHEYEFSSTE